MVNIDRPLIAITMGDAAGIGPEIIAKALQSEDIYHICRPIVIGDIRVMHRAFLLIKSPEHMHKIQYVNEVEGAPGTIDILDMNNISENEVNTGKLCKACGKASVDFITRATELAMNNEVRAIVTAPINKEATRLAGCGDLGHMELFTTLTGTAETATMLMSGHLRRHLTTHHSLTKALGLVPGATLAKLN
jgi:4-hydroxythreonine-4-phosphate dehydrogenase